MEESLSFLDKINASFACGEIDLKTYSPLTLAYVGDDVYDLVVRTVIVKRANRAANELHKAASNLVKAQTQARMAEVLQPLLTQEEEAVYRRGRNAKSGTSAKNASIVDYRKATGLEALFGYLYLDNQFDRVLELMKAGFAALKIEI